jgi:hypothetical protein
MCLVAVLASGCARYEYDLVRPPELSRHIGRELDAVVQMEPLEYRFRTVDNRLVVRIFNQSDETIQLIGERSSVVDPDGQSHPLRGGPIAPHSFLKLIIPPPRPTVYDSGPTFGVGLGVGVSRHYHRHPFYHGYYYDYFNYPYDYYYMRPCYDFYDEPRYLSVHDENDTFYWDWKGEGEARLMLVYQRGDKEFRHEFMFRRRKM